MNRCLPWYKVYCNLYRHEMYTRMPLDQQGVYRNLLDYVGEQNPRGTFQAEDLELLALQVARGNMDVLKATLQYCSEKWRGDDGTPHILITEERGVFTTYEKHQRKASDEPEASAERQQKKREADKNDVTRMSRVTKSNVTRLEEEVEEDLDRESEKESEKDADCVGGELPALHFRVASLFPEGQPDNFAASIQRKIASFQSKAAENGVTLDYEMEALDCMEWHRAHKRKVDSWLLAYGNWLKKSVVPQRQDRPGNIVPMRSRVPTPITPIKPTGVKPWDDALLELKELVGDDNYAGWFAPLRPSLADNVLTLTAPDAEHQGYVEDRLHGQIHDALELTGHGDIEIRYATAKKRAKAAS